jgi:hypothetical protein
MVRVCSAQLLHHGGPPLPSSPPFPPWLADLGVGATQASFFGQGSKRDDDSVHFTPASLEDVP